MVRAIEFMKAKSKVRLNDILEVPIKLSSKIIRTRALTTQEGNNNQIKLRRLKGGKKQGASFMVHRKAKFRVNIGMQEPQGEVSILGLAMVMEGPNP